MLRYQKITKIFCRTEQIIYLSHPWLCDRIKWTNWGLCVCISIFFFYFNSFHTHFFLFSCCFIKFFERLMAAGNEPHIKMLEFRHQTKILLLNKWPICSQEIDRLVLLMGKTQIEWVIFNSACHSPHCPTQCGVYNCGQPIKPTNSKPKSIALVVWIHCTLFHHLKSYLNTERLCKVSKLQNNITERKKSVTISIPLRNDNSNREKKVPQNCRIYPFFVCDGNKALNPFYFIWPLCARENDKTNDDFGPLAAHLFLLSI